MPAPRPSSASVQDHEPAAPPRRRDTRRLSGLALFAGALTLSVAETIHPEAGDGPSAMAESFAALPGVWRTWGLLLMATALLLLPGVVALRSLVPEGPGRRLTVAGSLVTGAALVALFAFAQIHVQGVDLAGAAPVSPDVVEAFLRADAGIGIGVTAVLALLGFHLGWALLLAGLARARVVALPLAALGVAGALGSFFADPLGHLAESTAFYALAAAIVAAGWALVRPAGAHSALR